MSVSPLRTADIILLAEELRAMVRAGMPLSGGLREAASSWSGRLAQAAQQLAKDLENGVPLAQALNNSPEIPAEFRALVAGGLASGRVVDVLESYAVSSRLLLDLRESLVRGAMYPFIIALTGFVLLVSLLFGLFPMVARTFELFELATPWWFASASRFREAIVEWSWPVPLGVGLFALAACCGFWRTRGSLGGWLGKLPLTRPIVDDYHLSTASHLLSMLIRAEIPLPVALSLTGDTLNSRRVRRGVDQASSASLAGAPATNAIHDSPSLPPLWRSLFLSSGGNADELATGLEQVAELYSYRASTRAEFLARVIPVLLVCVVGGGITFLYANALFVPLAELWRRLGGV